MAEYYADSSVLVKRHVNEIGSDWVRSLTDPATENLIITTRLSFVEICSALNRRVRETSITALDYAQMIDDVTNIWGTQYEIIEFTATVADRAKQLLESHPLRAYDAVQLASALLAQDALRVAGVTALNFLAADEQLLIAAQAEGMATDNPNHHP
jgi:uncharacterized protein